jgi:putative transposase
MQAAASAKRRRAPVCRPTQERTPWPRCTNTESKAAAVKAAQTFAAECGAKARGGGQAVDDVDVLTVFYDYAAEHRIHLRTTNRIESTFVTVLVCTRVP